MNPDEGETLYRVPFAMAGRAQGAVTGTLLVQFRKTTSSKAVNDELTKESPDRTCKCERAKSHGVHALSYQYARARASKAALRRGTLIGSRGRAAKPNEGMQHVPRSLDFRR